MGATLYLTGRNEHKLRETLAMLSGEGHRLIAADLTVPADLEKLVDGLPGLDGVVQCAGAGSRVLCKAIGTKDLQDVFAPNLFAPILLQASLLSHKKINKSASVVFIASRAAEAPAVGNAIYSASKGALISYAKVLALELAPRQIRVNCINPAMVWTDLIVREGVGREELEEAQLKYPLKRYGQPGDISGLAVYLLSDASCWMTGSNLDITGGSVNL